MNSKKIASQIEKLVAEASFNLRPDVKRFILRAWRSETKHKPKQALSWIIENANIARSKRLAICQDSGLPVVFIEAGKNIKLDTALLTAIKKGVEAGYRKNYLRPSLTDPFKRKSSYRGVICHTEFTGRRGLKLTILPKGFGSENKSQLKMLRPTASIDEIVEFIVSAVKKAGPESCPPFVVGVGIGGTSDSALLLAKKALIKSLDKPNPDKAVNSLERIILKKINALGIGPMGLGGKTTALAVKINKAPTHIAGLPVGINISCHALRSKTINLIIK